MVVDPLVQRLERTLGLEAGEARVLAWGAAALFLAQWAVVSTSNVSDTLFLKRVGVLFLPFILLTNSVLMTVTTFAVGRLAVRVDHRRLLIWTFVALAVSLLGIWLLVVEEVTGAFSFFAIAAKQMGVIALLVFWNAIGGLLSGRQGKRLFARITAGGTLGTIVGSFTSGPLCRVLGIPALLPFAAAMLLLGALAALPLRRYAAPRFHSAERGTSVVDDQSRRLLPLWREGRLFHLLVFSSLLGGLLGPMLYFEFSYVADIATKGSNGEQELLDLYALLRGWTNVGVLLIQVGGAATVFRKLGVPLAAAVTPVIYLLGFVGLGVQLSLTAGVAAMLAVSLQDNAVYEPAQRILVSLFPERVRATVTTLIQGPVKRGGAVLGSLVVMAALALGTQTWVSWIGVPIASLWLILALMLWRVYPNLLLEVASARRTAPDESGALAEVLDTGTLRALERNLGGDDPERCRAACELIVEASAAYAAGALVRALPAAPAANRPLLVDALERLLENIDNTDWASPEAARDVAVVLAEAQDMAALNRAHLVQAYSLLLGPAPIDAEAGSLLTRALEDESAAVRLAAAAALRRGGLAPAQIDRFETTIGLALQGSGPDTRQIAREELRCELLRSDLDQNLCNALLALLAAQLVSEADRPQAAAAFADVAARRATRVTEYVETMLAYDQDANTQVRTAVVRFLGNLGLVEYADLMVEHLSADDPAEVRAASAALRALGAGSVEPLLRALRAGGRRTHDTVLSILRGLPVDPAGLTDLVNREFDTIGRLLVATHKLDAAKTVSQIVIQRLRERVDESVHTVLLLLAAVLDDDRIARVCRLLGRAWNPRDRAILLEALEALLPSSERQRLLPLMEDRSTETLARTAKRVLGVTLQASGQALAEELASEDPLTAALIAGTREKIGTPAEASIIDEKVEASMLSAVETILHLRCLDLFEHLTVRQLSDLAAAVEESTVPDGTTIVREGDFDDRMYLIVSGRVRITKTGRLVADLGPREFFGEMSVFDGETRSASATASGPVRLLQLARHDLFEIIEDQPAIGIAICQTLSRRVRNLLNERSGASEGKAPLAAR